MSCKRCEELSEKVAELRDVFDFGLDKDRYLGEIIHSPEYCIDVMITLIKNRKLQ